MFIEEDSFKYVGMNISYDSRSNAIILDQKDYINAMKTDLLPMESMRDKTDMLMKRRKGFINKILDNWDG